MLQINFWKLYFLVSGFKIFLLIDQLARVSHLGDTYYLIDWLWSLEQVMRSYVFPRKSVESIVKLCGEINNQNALNNLKKVFSLSLSFFLSSSLMFLCLDKLARVNHTSDSLLPDCLAMKFGSDLWGYGYGNKGWYNNWRNCVGLCFSGGNIWKV